MHILFRISVTILATTTVNPYAWVDGLTVSSITHTLVSTDRTAHPTRQQRLLRMSPPRSFSSTSTFISSLSPSSTPQPPSTSSSLPNPCTARFSCTRHDWISFSSRVAAAVATISVASSIFPASVVVSNAAVSPAIVPSSSSSSTTTLLLLSYSSSGKINNNPFDTIRFEIRDAQGGVAYLRACLEQGDFHKVLDFTKQYDVAFRKAAMVTAKKRLPKEYQERGTSLCNAVTFDLIGINRNSRKGQENAQEAIRYLDELVVDAQGMLALEPYAITRTTEA